MTHGSHRNYKISVIDPFETDEMAANGVLMLCLKSKPHVKLQLNLPAG